MNSTKIDTELARLPGRFPIGAGGLPIEHWRLDPRENLPLALKLAAGVVFSSL